jgi:TctA family transporter
MGIIEGSISGFMQALSLSVLPYMVVGAAFGLIVGIIPGLSGHFAMAMLIPFLYTMEPATGVAFLIGAHSTVTQGGGLTAILFGIPGTGSNVPTLFDGTPMREKGEGGVAVGAAMTSCFLGALLGSIVIALLLPAMTYIVLLFGPPEVFVLVILALTFVSVLGEGDLVKSIISALCGLLLAMVGLDNVTNQERFTFGLLELHDGLELVPVILGLFAVSEMFELWAKGGSLVGDVKKSNLTAAETQKQIFRGVWESFRHWWLVLRCCSFGVVLGLIPGLGAAAASFIGYAHAKQTSKHPETFGKGNVAGVIAPESCINATEGGALGSTLAFGIPGSSSMAILLAGFFIMGVETGPKMLTENVDLVFVMIHTIWMGGLLGMLAGMFLINPLTRASAIRAKIIVPVLICTIFTGAYAVNFAWFDIGIAVLFGLIGYMMKELQYSRAAMLIGFVLGFAIEKNLYLAVQLDGPYFIFDPVPLGLAIFTLAFLCYSIWKLVQEKKKESTYAE